MAKAILKFDLNDIEDKTLFQKMSSVQNMYNAMWEIYNLRKQFEYLEDDPGISKDDYADEIFRGIHQILEENEISIDLISN
jgi:hypothetical protein